MNVDSSLPKQQSDHQYNSFCESTQFEVERNDHELISLDISTLLG